MLPPQAAPPFPGTATDAFAVHLPAFATQKNKNAPMAVARPRLRNLLDPLSQIGLFAAAMRVLVNRRVRRTAQARRMLTFHSHASAASSPTASARHILAPIMERRLGDTGLPAHIADRCPRLRLLQNKGNLCLVELRPLHGNSLPQPLLQK